ncbi:azurin [Flavivirga jejuensis]|uniref:Azurin n=1 Tax=Flavivirga jejuensis TaxID=870487 RepID=A0ABT8WIM5_9FLAO|nr:azurin [Flavivirga jejuensis]MDO5973009.1 azurin [Flavivirga jejuensis]
MKTFKYLILSFFSILVLVSCGGKEEKKKAGFSYENKKETSKSAEEKSANEIAISGNDNMQFDKTEIKVKAGQKVKITLRHIGKLDVNVMGHNFVLLKQGVDVAGFAGKAAAAGKESQYIPKKTKDVIAYTSLIGAGGITSVEFDAPAVGVYDYICSFPGHYGMMKGKFIVE